MMCDGCSSSVTKALESVEGVASVAVDLEAKTATVELTADAAEGIADKLIDAVSGAGFDAALAQ
eukprot:PRCOL_00005448-RA